VNGDCVEISADHKERRLGDLGQFSGQGWEASRGASKSIVLSLFRALIVRRCDVAVALPRARLSSTSETGSVPSSSAMCHHPGWN